MRIRTRHLAALCLCLCTLVIATAAWLLVGAIGALAVVGLFSAAWSAEVWSIRRKPEYHERRRLYLRLEQWIYSRSCSDLLKVDGLFVQCCPHMVGPNVRLWPQVSESRNICVDDYMLHDLVPRIRHGMMLGTVNCHGEVEVPQPTTLRAIVHRARFEHDSGIIETSLAELHELLDRLDRATPVRAHP